MAVSKGWMCRTHGISSSTAAHSLFHVTEIAFCPTSSCLILIQEFWERSLIGLTWSIPTPTARECDGTPTGPHVRDGERKVVTQNGPTTIRREETS